jgi:hypothetical protein
MKRCTRDHQVRTAADPVLGISVEKVRAAWDKISTAGVLRLRATSAVSRDKSVRRSAQDDDFVGVLTKKMSFQSSGTNSAAKRDDFAL